MTDIIERLETFGDNRLTSMRGGYLMMKGDVRYSRRLRRQAGSGRKSRLRG